VGHQRFTPNYLDMAPWQQTAIDRLSPSWQDNQAIGNFGASVSRFGDSSDLTQSGALTQGISTTSPTRSTRLVGSQTTPLDAVLPEGEVFALDDPYGKPAPDLGLVQEGSTKMPLSEIDPEILAGRDYERFNLNFLDDDDDDDDVSLNPWSKAGSMMNIFGPTAITALQRLGDRPNPNYFENYGTEGLRTQGQAFGAAAGSRDRSLADVDRAVAAQRFRTQSGARGVNTQRALDMTTLQQGGHQKQQIRDNYRQHVANLFRERAGLQDRRDQVVMGGAAKADVADRQDRAAFHTNLAKSLTQGAKSAQQYGKMQDLAQAISKGQLEEYLRAARSVLGQ